MAGMRGIIKEFEKFALRGNLVDLAIGFTVGAAFTAIAQSLVDDIIMPVVGYLMGGSDFADLFILMQAGPEAPPPYPTLADAQAAGAVTINYGIFINSILAFLVVAIVMFFLIRAINRVDQAMKDESGIPEKPEERSTKKCPYCVSNIPCEATRCPQCTSQLEPVAG